MPALPVIEKIAVDVLGTLNGVKIASGYSIDLTARRRSRSGNNPAHGLCVIYQGPTQPDAMTTGASIGAIYRRVPFVLQVYVIETADQANTDAIDTALNLVAADIEKALMIDPQRSENAHDTILGDPEPFDEGENGHTGVLIPFECQYGFVFSDPTTPL